MISTQLTSHPLIYFCTFIFLAILGNLTAWATTDSGDLAPHETVTIKIVEPSLDEATSTWRCRLRLNIAPNHHIYAPPQGALGEPICLETSSEKSLEIKTQWPNGQPKSSPLGMYSVYEGVVDIPITIKNKSTDQNVYSFTLKYIVCGALCTPEAFSWSIPLPPAPFAPSPLNTELFLMMLFAFIGGFILNFMPCVLPVLGLKLVAFSNNRYTKELLRTEALGSLVGIISSFLSLACVALLLRRAGHSFGWGMQFQHPVFLSFMALGLVIFATNVFNYWQIHLPQWIQKLGLKKDTDFAFGQGIMGGIAATLLATPCTAPFLGTALGYSLTQGTLATLLLFLLMAIGFGFPYILLLGLSPKKLVLPKGKKWVLHLKTGIGALLLITSFWLVWLLGFHLSTRLLYGAIFCLMSLFFLLKSLQSITSSRTRKTCLTFIATLSCVFLYLPHHTNQPIANHETSAWQTFDDKKLKALVRDGKTVFVDITAHWCLTCQVNKKNTLETPTFKSLCQKHKIVLMRGDLTQHNPAILTYMHGFKRAGIPLNVIYTRRHPKGLVLSELLTLHMIQDALQTP